MKFSISVVPNDKNNHVGVFLNNGGPDDVVVSADFEIGNISDSLLILDGFHRCVVYREAQSKILYSFSAVMVETVFHGKSPLITEQSIIKLKLLTFL